MSEQPSSTSPHPNCPLCANPDRAQYVSEDEDSVYATGELVILQESVHTPIRHIFDASGSPLVIHPSQPNILTGPLGPSHDSSDSEDERERRRPRSANFVQEESLIFPGLRRLGLRGVKSLQPHIPTLYPSTVRRPHVSSQ